MVQEIFISTPDGQVFKYQNISKNAEDDTDRNLVQTEVFWA